MGAGNGKWRFAVDRGGTFTDVVGLSPKGCLRTEKLLSSSPEYADASIQGIRRVLGLAPDTPLPEDRIEAIRFGTTVATNALLERKGGKVALLITKGFADLLEIGYQARPAIFDLCIRKPSLLYDSVFEVDERMDAEGRVVRPLNRADLEAAMDRMKKSGADAVAVVLLHAYRNAEHELLCERALKANGFPKIFLSHRTMNLIKVVARGLSTVADAYLSPVLWYYAEKIRRETGRIPIAFMQSTGGLSAPESLKGRDALLSGPAGGVVASAGAAEASGFDRVIGFDMGGTSTDVSRFDGDFERIYETVIGGVEIQTEMLNIHTVAAGGGSRLWFDGRKMRVGPESAGAYPGPACYGFGGPLTITDANLIAGRIVTEYFPHTFGPDRKSPLDGEMAFKSFQKLTDRINGGASRRMTPYEAALGFLKIANEKMAAAIKEISVSRGFDVREYALLCFGGAGGQHACAIAASLGIRTILFHPLGSVLSAYGIGLARPVRKTACTVLRPYDAQTHEALAAEFRKLEGSLLPPEGADGELAFLREIELRPAGAEASLTEPYTSYHETLRRFVERYAKVFGISPGGVPIEVVSLRVEVRETKEYFRTTAVAAPAVSAPADPVLHHLMHTAEGPIHAPVFLRETLGPGAHLRGPCYVVDPYTTVVLDPGFEAEMDARGTLVATMKARVSEEPHAWAGAPDPVLLEVFNNLFMNVAKEMGHTLRNTAHSVNIKERLDFSCALFDAAGDLVANAPHIPVHLGSMSDTVKGILEDHGSGLRPGDLYLTNNPYRGGSHLPDMTVVCPVFSEAGRLLFFTAARGHHADIGGVTPGSMPPHAANISEEGVLVDGLLLVREGRFMEEEVRRCFREHPYPVRNIPERIADLKAQVAACHKGAQELLGVIARFGPETVEEYMRYIQANAEFSVKECLARFLEGGGPFEAAFEDCLDDGTPLQVRVTIHGGEDPPETVRAVIDFTGTGPEHRGDNLNAPLSVTRSAILYVLRALTGTDIPLNGGCLHPVEIVAPQGTLLNPSPPCAVASGNVETSQRVVDLLLGALGVAGASQGTMNNLLFELEGDVPYYETVAGGAGAMEGCAGASGVQVHMTNTRITDPEILEYRHAGVRLERFLLRRGSGGAGRYPGGDGVIREIRFLGAATLSIISERRVHPPYGTAGGGPGKPGRNLLQKASGERMELPHRVTVQLQAGDTVILKTPGGGGFGGQGGADPAELPRGG